MNSSFSFRMPSTPTALFDATSIGNSRPSFYGE